MVTTSLYFGHALVDETVAGAAHQLLQSVNAFLVEFKEKHPDKEIKMSSGYRSPEHNAKIGGAVKSNHMTGHAIDIADYDRQLARFCLTYTEKLAGYGLYCEDLRATKTWVHFQDIAPKSGMRFFIPSSAWAEKLAGKPLRIEDL